MYINTISEKCKKEPEKVLKAFIDERKLVSYEVSDEHSSAKFLNNPVTKSKLIVVSLCREIALLFE